MEEQVASPCDKCNKCGKRFCGILQSDAKQDGIDTMQTISNNEDIFRHQLVVWRENELAEKSAKGVTRKREINMTIKCSMMGYKVKLNQK